jgi:hypothetical protein
MLVIVPTEIGSGLATIEAGLKNLDPGKIFAEMSSKTKIVVSLPRIRLESFLEMIEPLRLVGKIYF